MKYHNLILKYGFYPLSIALVLTLGPLLSSVPSTAHASKKIEPVRVVLKNGITILVVETHALPVVNISVTVKTGSVYDPPEKAGLSSLTAALLDEGTKTRSSQQIADEMDFIGGKLSTGGGTDFSTASLVVLKKDIKTGLDILSDVLMNPVFPEEEVERKKKEVIGAIISDKDDPGSVASKAFYKAVFKNHPYGIPGEGDEESVVNISRDDIVKFFNTYYRPNNTIMAVVGDVDIKEVVTLIETYFKSWKKAEISFPTIPSAGKVEKKESVLIDRDITQANIMLGHVGISRDNPDFYAVHVMNYILGGGGFSSRLTKEIRDNKGLAYSVHSGFDINKYPGAFTVSIQTKNETTQVAVEGILVELKKIREEQVSDEELNDATSYLTGSFPLKLDTNSKISSYLVFIEFYNLGLDYFDAYKKKIEAVTKDDIIRVAKKYIDPENYVFVAVAKQKDAGLKELE